MCRCVRVLVCGCGCGRVGARVQVFLDPLLHCGDTCVCFVDVRVVMCAQVCMIPFYSKVCVCVCLCVCVVLLVCAHRVSMILFYNKVIHVCVCLHVCGRAVFHYFLVQGVCV